MKRKFNIWWYIWSFIFLICVAVGIYLLVTEKFVMGCFGLGLIFLLLFGIILFDIILHNEWSYPTKFYLIEVERWIDNEYKKVYFVEEEQNVYTFIYQFLYKTKIQKTNTDYELDDYFKTEESAMTYILDRVKSFIKLTKKEERQIIKSIKTLKELSMDDLVKEIMKK